MDYVNEFDKLICDLSSVLGKPIDKTKYEIIDRGIPHQPRSLPKGMMGVYIFLYEGDFLKIGEAGPSSNARFLSQHYNPRSAPSTLAASVLSDISMRNKNIHENNVGDWIKNNCRRIDILFDSSLGVFTLKLVEAALHYKYEPKYEGYEAQRLK